MGEHMAVDDRGTLFDRHAARCKCGVWNEWFTVRKLPESPAGKSEHEELLERLRLKVQATYTQAQDVLNEFVRWCAAEGRTVCTEASVTQFLEFLGRSKT